MFVGPITAGIIVDQLGWQYSYVLLAVLGSILLVVHIVAVPETLNKVGADMGHRKSRNG